MHIAVVLQHLVSLNQERNVDRKILFEKNIFLSALHRPWSILLWFWSTNLIAANMSPAWALWTVLVRRKRIAFHLKWLKMKTRQIWGIWKLRPAYSPETPNLGQNRCCFVPCDLEIWWMTLENNRASLLCCFKLCAKFHSHRWIQTGVTVPKHPIWVKFDKFWETCDLEIWLWPWKTIGHLYYATSSSMHHFVAIGEFKLELQSGNAQFGSKSTIFFNRVTLKFDGWPSKTIGHLFYDTSSLGHHFVAIGEFKLELQSGNAQSSGLLCKLLCWRPPHGEQKPFHLKQVSVNLFA